MFRGMHVGENFWKKQGYHAVVNEMIGVRIEEHPQETRVIMTFSVSIEGGS